jgi:Uma2 family endonuclease
MEKENTKPDSEVKEALPAYDQRYTYDDYLTWDDDIRRELIDGIVYEMSAPSWQHQRIGGNLFILFGIYLKDKPCEVFYAPFDVRLTADTYDDTVVQPDLLITCDRLKMEKRGLVGAPDMVVEILSPSTSRYDRTLKFDTYLRAGIKEYWIIDPETKTLAINLLNDGNYITYSYTDEDTVSVHILKDCTINLSEVFREAFEV